MEDQSLLGAPPLIPFDDPAAYDRLLAAVTEAIKPVDFLEMIWARDVADLQWEITRCRRIRAKIIVGGVESEITGDDYPAYRASRSDDREHGSPPQRRLS